LIDLRYYREHKEERKEYQKSTKGKMAIIRATLNSRKRHPDRWNARYATRRAVRIGTLAQLACEKCGNFLSEAHHVDYSKPLEVIWLCKKHHAEITYANI
jgi:hypothetical protein